MSIDDKILMIETKKLEVGITIKYTHDMYKQNIEILDSQIEYHKDFHNFIDKMKICELFKWEYLKGRFNHIKKKITADKKLSKKVSKLYGSIINYYTNEDRDYLNKLLTQINEYRGKMLFDFEYLKGMHKNLLQKIKTSVNSPNITKIYKYRNEYDEVYEKIYKNFMNLKLLDKEYYLLKKKKAEVISELTPKVFLGIEEN
jgi:hypothetical protein